MRKSHFGTVSVFLCLAAAGACAQGIGAEKKWYVGLDLGLADLNGEAIFEGAGGDAETSLGYTIRVGYRFNRYFALETGYADLGDFDATYSMACIPEVPCPEIDTTTSIDGFLLNLVGIWPVSGHIELNFSAGLIYRDYKITAPGPSAGIITLGEDPTDTIAKFGVGLSVPINPRLEAGLDLTHYQDVGMLNNGDSNVVSLGLRWKF